MYLVRSVFNWSFYFIMVLNYKFWRKMELLQLISNKVCYKEVIFMNISLFLVIVICCGLLPTIISVNEKNKKNRKK
ncbi:hypothetical protein BU600_04550 [Staphylococcus arlettae]|nr:hypothetical protein BU598_11625 [Staphylococcus arlettae]RIM70557.1 hypothetical protein BU600_04550 [Staphylococcus arlettae]